MVVHKRVRIGSPKTVDRRSLRKLEQLHRRCATDQQELSRRHRIGSGHADMRVDTALRENGTPRETEMRGSCSGETLDRRADGENGLRELGGQIRNTELRIKFVDEMPRDRIIVP